jgi:ribosome biogenesis GTPase A
MEKDDQFINDMHFDTEKLNNLILTGYEKLQKDQIKNTNIVLVIGCTGSGKSTLINYLISNKIIFKNHFADTIAEAEKTGENFPEIGHSTESKTIYPKVFIDDQHDVAYCDFPGFFDNRSFEERVSITINTQSAILNSKNVEAIIVVLSQAELGAQRGKLFKSLSRLLDNLICDFESILPNIIFVLSKPYNNITSEQFYNHIEELANSNLSFLQDKIKNVAHIFKKQIEPETKERESSYKFLSAIVKHRNNFVVGSFYDQNCRNHIVNLIKSLSVKSIQKDKFNFDK